MRLRIIGGLLIQDGSEGEIIIAVLNYDAMFKNIRNANELPVELIERLKHAFIT